MTAHQADTVNFDHFTKLLESKGFKVVSLSANGKNQTRYKHLTLEKEGKTYFGKLSTSKTYGKALKNESLGKNFPDGNTYSFIKPSEEIEFENMPILIYPFIDTPTASSESNDFNDLTIPTQDLPDFYKSLAEALSNLSSSKIYPYTQAASRPLIDEVRIVEILGNTAPSSVPVIEGLKTLSKHRGSSAFSDTTPAIYDLQLQNMFWDSENKHLFVFDLEYLVNRPRHYDTGRFFASTFSVYNRPEMAEDWVKFYTQRIADSPGDLQQLQLMCLVASIEYYSYFVGINDIQRAHAAESAVDWSLHTYTVSVNDMLLANVNTGTQTNA